MHAMPDTYYGHEARKLLNKTNFWINLLATTNDQDAAGGNDHNYTQIHSAGTAPTAKFSMVRAINSSSVAFNLGQQYYPNVFAWKDEMQHSPMPWKNMAGNEEQAIVDYMCNGSL
jgi:hypothetical protein